MLSRTFARLVREDDGASLVEYGLVVILIAIVALTAVALAGDEVSVTYSEISSSLANT